MTKRKIIRIDEDKCDGCGECVPNCAEGALKIIGGKARLVSESACDGLGACIGHCPKGAITIIEKEEPPCGCPGARVMDFRKKNEPKTVKKHVSGESQLRQWPVQITLVSPNAPYLNNSDLLIAADCVPFAYADFHEDLLKGKALLIGCPKLDDAAYYKEKISEIIKNNNIKSITYAHMEVPCCSGLIGIIKEAIERSGKTIPFEDAVISIRGGRIK